MRSIRGSSFNSLDGIKALLWNKRKYTKIFHTLLILFIFLMSNIVSNSYSMFFLNSLTNKNVEEKYYKIWNIIWGGPEIEWAPGLTIDQEDHLYLVGFTGSFGAGNRDIYLMKISTDGRIIWNITWGGTGNDDSYGVIVYNNSIYVAVMTKNFGVGGLDSGVIKFDENGNVVWNITWGGPKHDRAYDISIDSKGDIYIAGCTTSYGLGSNDIFLVKFNQSGALIWNTTFGGTLMDYCYGIYISQNDEIYLVGWTESFGNGLMDAILLKYNTSGALIWNRTGGGTKVDNGFSVAVDSSNDVYITGYTDSFGYGMRDTFIVKYDSMGNQIWNKTYGGPYVDSGYDIVIDHNDQIIVIGSTNSSGAGNEDAFVAKFNQDGFLLWNCTWGGNDNDDGCDVMIDSINNIYLSGRTMSYGSGDWDAIIVKYSKNLPTTQNPTYYLYIIILF
ncbi:MAG: SBBP repeat-containing protein [Candidatus Helarchaeota archaeon]